MPQDHRKPVFKAMDYISQNLYLNPTLEEIARAVAVSSYHFHRIFRAQVGETVAEFTRRLRMERAALWLTQTPQRDITDLALSAGFSSSQNFAKAFRNHFSVSPGEYRRLYSTQRNSKPGNVIVKKSAYSQTTKPESAWRESGLQQASVVNLPARRVAYMRRFGAYGKETCQQTHQDLLASLPQRTPTQPAGTLCLYWDSPEVTSASRCRTDVCIEIGDREVLSRGVAVQTIAGGNYAVCRFAVFGEQLEQTWDIAFAWMQASGLVKSDKPCYEYYYNETDVALDYYVFDIGIALKNTPQE
ncbi:GyrI-like domain-containing protein [Enterobacteriaceae bacterium C34A]